MSKLFMFEKPLGMRDTFPVLYKMKETVKENIQSEMRSWGYEFIQTPTLEYAETVGEASAILDQQLFKLLDQQGRSIVLRPDMTAPIARVAASRLLKDQNPLRLAYSESVFRAQQHEGGRPAEFEQIGIECIGDRTVSADAEAIALMVSTLQKAGVSDFTLSIGHIGFVHHLFLRLLGNEERASILRQYLYEKNYVGFSDHIQTLSLSSIDRQLLESFLQLRGSYPVLSNARSLIETEGSYQALNELEELWKLLQDYGVEKFVKFDLTLVSHMSYYTGVLFEAYTPRVGFPLGNGGRYDDLLKKFGKEAGATGFGIRLDYLLEALALKKEKSEGACVIFSNERRKEAIAFTQQKRESGVNIVLQDMKGIGDMDRFSNSFKDVHYFIGSMEGGKSE